LLLLVLCRLLLVLSHWQLERYHWLM